MRFGGRAGFMRRRSEQSEFFLSRLWICILSAGLVSDAFVIPFSTKNTANSDSTTTTEPVTVTIANPSPKAMTKKPFASLMPSSSTTYHSPSSRPSPLNCKPHRPFPPTYRNPGDHSSKVPAGRSLFQTKSLSPDSAAAQQDEGKITAHRPFPPEYRNPDTTTTSPNLSLGSDAVEDNRPHQPRNPSSVADGKLAASENKAPGHQPFSPEHRNADLTATTDNKATSQQMEHRAFSKSHRNPEQVDHQNPVVAEVERRTDDATPHRSFPVRHRNPDGNANASPLSTWVDFRQEVQAEKVGITTDSEIANAVSPLLPRPNNKISLEETTQQHPHRSLDPLSHDPEPPQTSIREFNVASPPGSEKSFETADGGSSGVHVRLSDDKVAGNGEALVSGAVGRTANSATAAKVESRDPRRSGEGGGEKVATTEGRKEKGLLRGLKNSLRRKGA